MEREWRTIGDVAFGLADVRRIILPQVWAAALRASLPEYCGQVLFSG
jgi:hypothetical protein